MTTTIGRVHSYYMLSELEQETARAEVQPWFDNQIEPFTVQLLNELKDAGNDEQRKGKILRDYVRAAQAEVKDLSDKIKERTLNHPHYDVELELLKQLVKDWKAMIPKSVKKKELNSLRTAIKVLEAIDRIEDSWEKEDRMFEMINSPESKELMRRGLMMKQVLDNKERELVKICKEEQNMSDEEIRELVKEEEDEEK
jgi:hypothetical protein